MGCGASSAPSVPVSQKSRAEQAPNLDSTTIVFNTDVTAAEIVETYEFLVNGAGSFRCPPGCVPIACLSDNVIPVIVSCLFFNSSAMSTKIYLPILAVANVGRAGRLAVFGHIYMLSRKFFDSQETAVVILNTFLWLNGKRSIFEPIKFIGFHERFHSEIKHSLQPQGIRPYFCDIGDVDLSRDHMIIISSEFDVTNKEVRKSLRNYLEEGHGIGIFYVPKTLEENAVSSGVSINKLIRTYGVAFTSCALSSEHATGPTVNVSASYDAMKRYLFGNMVESFTAQLAHPETLTAFQLDDWVTTIRYYVMACHSPQHCLLRDLMESCWKYMDMTGYRTPDGELCPKIEQSMIIFLLRDLAAQFPISTLPVHPDAAHFPGACNSPIIDSLTLHLELRDHAFTSTGLWLHPGAVTTIECANPPPDLHIQIGVHTIHLIMKPGPWKRWPSVVTAFPLTNGSTEVISEFGGVVHIAAGDLPSPTVSLDITFHNFSRHPVFSSDAQLWSDTKDLDCPWGEFVSPSIIFTMPTQKLREITSHTETSAIFEQIISILCKLVAYTVDRPYRVVFDVETANDLPLTQYPIMMLVDDIDDIFFNTSTPTSGLFKLIVSLVTVSLREGVFDTVTENALSVFLTCLIFNNLFPYVEQIDSLMEPPPLFRELWYIHTKIDRNIITEVVRKSQDPDCIVYDTQEDMWLAFVKELCDRSHKDMIKVFQETRPIPMSMLAENE